MLLSYKDKDRALRFGEIWLQFLEKNGIKSWNQITEKLVVDDFKVWRKNTPIPRGTGNKTLGQPPSNAVVNQHMQYLFKSFNKAVSQRKMISNPIFEIIPEKHIKKEQDVLTFDEFEKVIALLNGSVLQIVLLLFCSCKRRKEIVLLQIEDIDYKNHYVHYTEWKNSEKIRLRIEKAFHITQAMELFFKRIVGNRTSGPIWSDVTPEYVSSKYEDAVEQIVPKKKTTLKTIRQLCTEVMTEAGLSKEEKDFTLHNTVTERFYENQAAHAVYKRLAERSKKGIEVLSKTAEEYL
jgi:integrase